MTMAVSFAQIRQAIKAHLNPPDAQGRETWRFYVRDVYPGGYAIVEDEQAPTADSARYLRVDYVVNDKDQVVIGAVTKVKIEYVPVLEAMRLLEAEAVGDTGLVWRVSLIRPGWSANGFYYSPEVLGAAAALYEGAKAYGDHPTESEMKERPERSIQHVVGWYEGVRQEPDGRLTAELHLLERALWLGNDLKQRPTLYGLSHDVRGKTKIGEADGRAGRIVEAIAQVKSVDVVTEAAAGGTVDQLIASNRPSSETDPRREDPNVDWNIVTLEALRQARPDLVTKIEEAVKTATKSEPDPSVATLRESVNTVTRENKILREAMAAMKSEAVIATKVGASNLPATAKARVQKLMEASTLPLKEGGALDVAALEIRIAEAITAEQDYLAAVVGTGVRNAGDTNPTASTIAEAVKAADEALDRAFGIADPKKEGN